MKRKERLLSFALLVFFFAPHIRDADAAPPPVRLGGMAIDVAARSKISPFSIEQTLDPAEKSRTRHALVQFAQSLSPRGRKRIERTGVHFLQYIPTNAYFVAGTADALDSLRKSDAVIGLIAVPGEAKLDTRIREKAKTSAKTAQTARLETVKAVFFEDTSFKEARTDLLAHGAVLEATRTGFDFRQTLNAVTLPAHRLHSLASEDILYLLTEVDPPPEPTNLDAQDTSNVDEIQPGGETGYDLDGTGVTVGVWDAGVPRVTHEQIIGRATQEEAGIHSSHHASHVAGTIAGNGTRTVQAKGMAPNATILCWHADNDLSEVDANAHRISASNHSYKNSISLQSNRNAKLNISRFSVFGKYTARAQAWDQIVSDHDLIVVRSAGNEQASRLALASNEATAGRYTQSRSGVRVDEEWSIRGYDTIIPSGVAKNIITVGAIRDLTFDPPDPRDSSMTGFSSWGPTDDGRIKPDLVANGESLRSMVADADDAYAYNSGTSMSAPVVTGVVACLVQQYRRRFGGADPAASTVKAILIHTARDGGSLQGPDCRFGWGVVDARAAADFIESHGLGENQIELDSFVDSPVEYPMVYAGEGPIKVTLVWTDAPGIPVSGEENDDIPNLVNDLDLSILGRDGTHHPWTLDPLNPTLPTRQDRENHEDNIEQVFIESPVSGPYTIQINGQVNLGDYQDFSVCVTGLHFGGDTPHLMLAQPSNGEIISSTTVQIYAHATDNLGVSRIIFKVDGVIIDDATTEEIEGEILLTPPQAEATQIVTWDASMVANGSHTVEVAITDTDGLTTARSITVFIYNEAEITPLRLDGPTELSRLWPSGDVDWFSFGSPISGTYTIQTHPATDRRVVDTMLTLYGPDSQEMIIYSNDDGGTGVFSKITYVLEGNRTYYAKVEGYNRSTGPYAIQFRTAVDEEPSAIVPLVVNGPMVPTEAATSQDRWYSFRTEVFGTHRILTAPLPGYGGALPQILLYSAEDRKILASSTRPGASISWVLEGGQDYLVKVAFPKGAIEGYSIGIFTESTGTIAPLLIDGPAQAGSVMSATAGENWYSIFTPAAESYVLIEVRSASNKFTTGPQITLYGPDSPNLEIVTGSPRFYPPLSSRVFASLKGDATHFVKIVPNGWSGTYTIEVRRVPVESLFTITRSFSPSGYLPGEPLTVTLTADSPADSLVSPSAVIDVVPPGWMVTEICEPGVALGTTRVVIWWRWIPEGTNQLTYRVVPPEDAKGTYAFYGQLSYRVGRRTFGVRVSQERYLSEQVPAQSDVSEKVERKEDLYEPVDTNVETWRLY